MNKIEFDRDWLNQTIPQGLKLPSSTLISGPGGSGKPLVGLGIVYDWLKKGGDVIFLPLQYPKTKFVKRSLKQLYDLKTENYGDRISYVRFDLDLDSWEREGSNKAAANLLKPEAWRQSIRHLESDSEEGPGTLVFASALNLLLFSPTYKEKSLNFIEELIKEGKDRSYLFTVSTSAFREQVRCWEQAADNLMFTEMKEGMKLYLRAERLNEEEANSKDVKVPLEKEMLQDIKQVAEGVRERKIPKLKKI